MAHKRYNWVGKPHRPGNALAAASREHSMLFMTQAARQDANCRAVARPTAGASLLMLLAATGVFQLEAADRVTVVVPPAAQETAEQLVESAAAACNQGDFIGFMDHFTAAHARRIRQPMEDIFVQHRPRMVIRRVTLLSETPERIAFGVQYAWHDRDRPEELLASKLTARIVNGRWKLDGEVVKSSRWTVAESQMAAVRGGPPAAWNPFDPPADLIDPNLERLRGDIGIQPGRGCANGRCGR